MKKIVLLDIKAPRDAFYCTFDLVLTLFGTFRSIRRGNVIVADAGFSRGNKLVTKMVMLTSMAFILSACASVEKPLSIDDKFIKASLVGTWVAELNDKKALPGISNYRNNGRLEYIGFQTKKCVTPQVLVKAHWRVQDGVLIIVVQDSTNHQWYPPGMIVEDKVVQISDNRLVLENSEGALEYRVKSETCLTEKVP